MTPLLLAAAITLIGASDASQSVTVNSPPPQAQAPKPKTDDPDRVVCRTEPVTGSRFNKRVCLTRAQWDQQSKASQDSMDQVREHTGLGMGGGGGFSGR